MSSPSFEGALTQKGRVSKLAEVGQIKVGQVIAHRTMLGEELLSTRYSFLGDEEITRSWKKAWSIVDEHCGGREGWEKISFFTGGKGLVFIARETTHQVGGKA